MARPRSEMIAFRLTPHADAASQANTVEILEDLRRAGLVKLAAIRPDRSAQACHKNLRHVAMHVPLRRAHYSRCWLTNQRRVPNSTVDSSERRRLR